MSTPELPPLLWSGAREGTQQPIVYLPKAQYLEILTVLVRERDQQEHHAAHQGEVQSPAPGEEQSHNQYVLGATQMQRLREVYEYFRILH